MSAAGRARLLCAALDRPRESYDVGLHVELVLGLLYLRVHEPALWQHLACETHRDSALKLLSHAQLPTAAGSPPVLLFGTGPQTPEDAPALVDMIRSLTRVDLPGSDAVFSTLTHFIDHALSRLERATGEHHTPRSLVQCMVRLVDPQEQDQVYDPFCRSGEFLAAAATHIMGYRRGEPAVLSLSGKPSNQRSQRLTMLIAALHGFEVNLFPHSSYAPNTDIPTNRKFNVVLTNPPFNMPDRAGRHEGDDQRWPYNRWPYGDPPRHNSNFAWLQHAVSTLAPGGRAAVLMPNSTTTVRTAPEAEIRTRMIEAGVIECVVSLPGQLFRSTGIPVSLWLLRGAGDEIPEEILLIDATGLGTMIDRVQRELTDEDVDRIFGEYYAWLNHCSIDDYDGEEGFARSVSYTEIRENDYVLSPRAYVQSDVPRVQMKFSLDAIKELRADLEDLLTRSRNAHSALDAELDPLMMGRLPGDTVPEGWKRVSLDEACKVLAGPGTVQRGEPRPSWVPVILPRNIKHNRITDGKLDAIEPKNASRLSRYQLEPGDVVCTRTGTLGRYGLVQPEQAHWLLGPGCMRLRPDKQVDPEYLTYYLNSPVAYTWLTDNATGSAVQFINTKTLGRMPLALPPLDVQREIGRILGALDSETAIQNRIGEITQKIRDLLLPVLIPGSPGAQQSEPVAR